MAGLVIQTATINPVAMGIVMQRVAAQRRNKQIVAGVAGTGSGVLIGAVAASKLGVDRKKAALVGGGIGLVGALIISRWL
jgi:hypothetical protein